MKDHLGYISKIDTNRNFGFVKSDIDNNSYYFNTKKINENLKLFDKVAFLVSNESTNNIATAIRKYYINKIGIKFIPRIDSTHNHIDIDFFLPMIIDRIENADYDHINEEFEFENIVGKSDCIPTKSEDKIIFAIRKGRLGHSRFILNGESVESKFITAVFKKVNTNTYIPLTIFCGRKAACEPYDLHASEKDLSFWKNHALIFHRENIIENSETELCPWNLQKNAISNLNNKKRTN